MKNKTMPILLLALIASACSPKIKSSIPTERPALAYDREVFVFDLEEAVPEGLVSVGELSIGDSGFTTNCSYNTVMEQARLTARESGANIVKITQHKMPSAMGSTCHRIKAALYYAEDTSTLAAQEKEPPLLDVDYALLQVYRYPGVGPLVGYNLQLGDSTLCRVKNNFKASIKIKKEGLNSLWAKTESKAEVPVDLVYGKTYYLRCGVKMGAVVGRPTLELVDHKTGKVEYEGLKAKNTMESGN